MSGGHDDFESEPVRGLPEKPPPGEKILWQGAPSWWGLAKEVFHVRVVAIYFAGLIAWRVGVRITGGGDAHAAAAAVVSLLPVTLIGLGLLGLLAWLCSRTTVYTITNRRLVLRIGVALPTAINIPFGVVGAAGLRIGADARGNIALSLSAADRLAYSTLWPHVRPWRLKSPEPMLRSIPDAARVADLLGKALREASAPTSVAAPLATRDGRRSMATGAAIPSAPVFPAGAEMAR